MITVGRDSSVGIAIRYGLDGPGIESRWVAKHSAPVLTLPAAHAAFYKTSTSIFARVKRPERGFNHPPHLGSRLKKQQTYISTPLLGLCGHF